MNVTQREIIDALQVQPAIDAETEIRRRVEFLKDYMLRSGSRGLVLGISGGQDSTLAGKLCQLAASEMRDAGHDCTFIAVRLPYGVQRDEDDAQRALGFIAADEEMVYNIQHPVDTFVQEFHDATGTPITDFNKGNVKARMRMIAQYAIAADRGMLVVGTDHAAEAVTGFFTKFGDGAADILPLSGLTKSQGAQLLQALEAHESLWLKTPTADLLDSTPGQSDEESLGVSYREIDSYLHGAQPSDDVASTIEHRYIATEHKRRAPVTVSSTWWREQAN